MANNVGSCCVRDGSGVQTGATTLKIMWLTMLSVVASVMAVVCKRTQQLSNYVAAMLAVVASVMAVVCKRVQQLSTMLGLAVHHGKDTTHKTL